jgi:hypothetical protein
LASNAGRRVRHFACHAVINVGAIMKAYALIVLGQVLFLASPARADEVDTEESAAAPSDTLSATRVGTFLPSTLTPAVGAGAAYASTLGGYDTAHGAPIASATAEVRIWGPLAVRGGADFSATRTTSRPTIGLRAQLMRQAQHGVDASLSVFYRPEGFTEPEGEIETFVSLGRQFDRIYVLGNLVYGQDPEGNERDGEVRAAALYGGGRWTLGLDSRARFAIGSQRSAMAAAEPKFDLVAGPIANLTVGPVALFAEAGPTVLTLSTGTAAGIQGLGGVGAAF